jgi:hypothetical protein
MGGWDLEHITYSCPTHLYHLNSQPPNLPAFFYFQLTTVLDNVSKFEILFLKSIHRFETNIWETVSQNTLRSYLSSHFINLGITAPKLNSHGLSAMIGSCAKPSFDNVQLTDTYLTLLFRRCFIPIDQSLVIDVLFCGYFRGWLVWNWFQQLKKYSGSMGDANGTITTSCPLKLTTGMST